MFAPTYFAPTYFAPSYFAGGGGTGGALANGVVTLATVAYDEVTASATDASGGTPPYTYQWQRSLTGGGVGFSNLAGETTLFLSDSTVTPSTTYFYRLQYTDDVASVVFSNEVQANVPAAPPVGGGSGMLVITQTTPDITTVVR